MIDVITWFIPVPCGNLTTRSNTYGDFVRFVADTDGVCLSSLRRYLKVDNTLITLAVFANFDLSAVVKYGLDVTQTIIEH